MTQTVELDMEQHLWTAADLVEQFGPIPLYRIRQPPTPGLATEEDVIAVHDRENRFCELIDGVLVQKTMGTYESYLASLLGHLLWSFVQEHNLGIVLGADGMLRLLPGQVRIPDLAFISWRKHPFRQMRSRRIAELVPDLAVEVLSKGNTRQEMDRKLQDYFGAGVDRVWYIDPERREVRVYSSPENFVVLAESQSLDGGELLPGFTLDLRSFFADPADPAEPAAPA